MKHECDNGPCPAPLNCYAANRCVFPVEDVPFVQSGPIPSQDTIPEALNRSHVKGWNEAIANAIERLGSLHDQAVVSKFVTSQDCRAFRNGVLGAINELRSLVINVPSGDSGA